MVRVAIFLAMAILCAQVFAAPSPHRGSTSIVTLTPQERRHFESPGGKGFVIVALARCSVAINGTPFTLQPGGFQYLKEIGTLDLTNSLAAPAKLVVIQVMDSDQPLTIESQDLSGHQQLEDANDRNETLLVALGSTVLGDVRDLKPEGEAWKSSRRKYIRLQTGESVWVEPGMHRLTNLGPTPIRFLTIEW